MDAASTTRANNQADVDRMQQEQSQRIREINRKHAEDLKELKEHHEREMSVADAAYRVEFSAKKADFDRNLHEVSESQTHRLTDIAQKNDISLKQAQDIYKTQAEEVKTLGEKRLEKLREDQVNSRNNTRMKGNA